MPAVSGIQVASPLVALMPLTLEVVLLIRYRNAINFGAVGYSPYALDPPLIQR
jgi:hypothetical protein